MNLTLRIWRQQSASARGSFVSYRINDVTPEMSFLEMLDMLNEDLINRQEPPVAFKHDGREGMRFVRFSGQRSGSGRPARHNGLSAGDALLQRRRHAYTRAVPRPGLPRPAR